MTPSHSTIVVQALSLKSLLLVTASCLGSGLQQEASRRHRGSSTRDDLPAVLVHYAFAGSDNPVENSHRLRNLEFFLRHAVTHAKNTRPTYRVTLNGRRPDAHSLLTEHNSVAVHQEKPPVITLARENTGYHFGAHAHMLRDESSRLQLLGPSHLPYQAYIFLNDGVRGPFLPTYMPRGWHWTQAFTDGLTALRAPPGAGGVALVGTSIVCLNEDDYAVKQDSAMLGPKVEAFSFALASPALQYILAHGTSFRAHETKLDSIVSGEYNLTRSVMAAPQGWGISSLLLAYKNLNFRDKGSWMCNQNEHPSRSGSYGPGTSISPLEVIFHKSHWAGHGVKTKELEAYSLWKDEASRRAHFKASREHDFLLDEGRRLELDTRVAKHKAETRPPVQEARVPTSLATQGRAEVDEDTRGQPAPMARLGKLEGEYRAPPLELAEKSMAKERPAVGGEFDKYRMKHFHNQSKPSVMAAKSTPLSPEGPATGVKLNLTAVQESTAEARRWARDHEMQLEIEKRKQESTTEARRWARDHEMQLDIEKRKQENTVKAHRRTQREEMELGKDMQKRAQKRDKKKAIARGEELRGSKTATAADGSECGCGWAAVPEACSISDGSYCWMRCCADR